MRPKTTELFADVIVPLAVPLLYTYSIPKKLAKSIQPGMRVEVQFGRRKLYAAIVRKIHNQRPTAYKLKPLLALLDDNPIVNEKQFAFWEWLAEYYLCDIGEVMLAALPAGLKLSSETRVFLNRNIAIADITRMYPELSSIHQLILEALQHQPDLTLNEIHRLLKKKSVYPYIKKLLEKKLIFVEEELQERYKPKMVPYVVLNETFQDKQKLKTLLLELQQAPKQLALLMAYVELSRLVGKSKAVRKTELLKRAQATSVVLQTMVKKGIFSIEEKAISRIAYEENNAKNTFELSAVQQEAMVQIKKCFCEKAVVLLHGVTSSGKTNIYIKLIEETLANEKQVLYLLPEIALTAQIIQRLRNYFGNIVGVYHSRFSDNERVEIWQKILAGEYRIVLGARSALFLPFDNLGLIIVDEEHDASYKQVDPAPRYHARDSAIYLASIHQAKTLLGTATPSLESYYNAQKGKYGFVTLKERYGGIELPDIVVIDLKHDRTSKYIHLTTALIQDVEQALANKQQVIIFQNRRGYVPYMECRHCGWTPRCKNCEVTLTYHKELNQLQCHYCGFAQKPPQGCAACGSPNVKIEGFGTEKIEEELQLLFPETKIMRMDLDSTRGKFAYAKIIEAFEERKVNILVGTQMVTKGLDFDHVAVVGILSAEHLFNHPDFRAHERAFQLMAQVSGRAGRKGKQGKVVIQTINPQHKIIGFVREHDYEGFYHYELAHRGQFKYPPLYRLIRLVLKHKEPGTVEKAAHYLAGVLKNTFGNNVFGPIFPPIPRVRNRYLQHILLKFNPRRENLHIAKQKVREILHAFQRKRGFHSVSIIADVDPLG